MLALFLQGFMKTADVANIVNTVGRAAKQTQTGQQLIQAGQDTLKSNPMLKKLRNINILGGATATSTAAAPQIMKTVQPVSKIPRPSLSIKDANRLEFNMGRFTATAGRQGLNAQLGLGGGLGLNASQRGGERYAGFMFRKEF